MAEGMDLLEAQIDAQRQRQEELVRELTDQRENVDFLRNLVLQQQAAQQVVLQQQAAQQVVPPQQPVAAGDPAMVGELKKLVGSMVTTQLLSNITVFKGAPKDYKRWIRDVERHVQATNGDDSAHIAIATQSAGGVVGDFIFRYRNDHAGATWRQIKDELAARFSDIVDADHAFSQLRNLKQKSGESVAIYAEKILELASDAFPNEDLANALVARQLIDVYVNGLEERYVARKILRDNPVTFAGAVDIAVNETRLTKKWTIRKLVAPDRSEPMEVDMVGSGPGNGGRVGHENYNRKRAETGHVNTNDQCYSCGKRGHYARDCRSRPRVVGPCYTCNQMGHLRRDCYRNQGAYPRQGNTM